MAANDEKQQQFLGNTLKEYESALVHMIRTTEKTLEQLQSQDTMEGELQVVKAKYVADLAKMMHLSGVKAEVFEDRFGQCIEKNILPDVRRELTVFAFSKAKECQQLLQVLKKEEPPAAKPQIIWTFANSSVIGLGHVHYSRILSLHLSIPQKDLKADGNVKLEANGKWKSTLIKRPASQFNTDQPTLRSCLNRYLRHFVLPQNVALTEIEVSEKLTEYDIIYNTICLDETLYDEEVIKQVKALVPQ